MPLNIEQLRTPVTADEMLDTQIGFLQIAGFQTTGWQPGRIQRTFMLMVSQLLADHSEATKQITELSFNGFARSTPLSLLADSNFDNQRQEAVRYAGPMRLTNTSTVPQTIEVRQLLAATDNDDQFQNTTGGVVSADGGVLDLQFEAVLGGSAGLVADGSVTRLLTPIAGVTVANSIGTPWFTTTGTDEEADSKLQQRNATKWGSLGIELVRDGYINLALEVVGIDKAEIDDNNPRGEGTVDVYVAAGGGLAGTSEKEALQLEFSRRVLGTSSDFPPLPASHVAVRDPPTQALQLTGQVLHTPNITSVLMQTRVEQALDDFLFRLPLGGNNYFPAIENKITLGDLHQLLEGVPGVRTVSLTDPTGDVSVASYALVLGSAVWNLTYIPVTT